MQQVQFDLEATEPTEKSADVNYLLDNPDALESYLTGGGTLEHAAYGVFDMPTSEGVADMVRVGAYENYKREDFMSVELLVRSTAEVNGDGQLEALSVGHFKPYELGDLDRTVQGLEEYPIFFEVNAQEQDAFDWIPSIEIDGLLVADPEGAQIFHHKSSGRSVIEGTGVLRLLDASGEKLGSLTFSFFQAR